MDYRERFNNISNHKNADRFPVDFCGTTLTGCHPDVIKSLAGYFSINAADTEEATGKLQLLFDCDFRRVGCLFDPDSDYRDYSGLSRGEYTDGWGVTRKFQDLYWDIVKSPFRDLSLDEIRDYKWPSASGIDKKVIYNITERAKRLFCDTSYVIVGEHPVFGFLELGCWMFGYDDFLYRLIAEPETADWFFDNYYTYVKEVNELYYGAIGDYIHVTTSGDDFGTQSGPFVSPGLFKTRIKPWYVKRINDIKQYTGAKFFHHTCGSVYRLLGDMADMGVDIINPIQPGAYEMEPERLKNGYGDRFTFWGGIDEQNILSHGTPEQVRAEVKRVIDIMNVNGGYVLAASHNIQPDVPAANIAAMFSAASD